MYFALFLCFSIISNSNGDAIVNIFGSAALAEFGEENTKYFYTNQYIYAFNVSEDYFNTYKREHCGDNSSFNVCLFGKLFVLDLSYEVLSNSNIGLMIIVVSKSNSIFPDEYTISTYGDIFPTYTGNAYFETSIEGTEYLLYDATISDVELYQGLLSQNGWVYDKETTTYKHTFNEGFVYLYMLTVTSTFRFVLQTE